MREALWVPRIHGPVDGRTVAWQVNAEHTRPLFIMVNKRAKPVTSEAANYNVLGAAFHMLDVSSFDYLNHPAWMIFDRHHLARDGLAGCKGETATPDWPIEAPTLGDLPQAMRVPADALDTTVER